MYRSPDGRILYTGGQAPSGLYEPYLVRRIDLQFPQSNYWTLLTQGYQNHTDVPATMIVDGISYDSVGVRFKGQTSYNTGSSQKKSFNITTNSFVPGQDLMGYQILNLNNAFQDESFLHEVIYQHQIRRHIPAAKSNFVKLYINGGNWGLYPNVQQLNKEFLKEWFLTNDGTNWRADRPPGSGGGMGGGWGDGTAALNYLGSDTADYQPYYTLKTSTKPQPWEDLVHTCDVLNNTAAADLDSLLPAALDVDRTLWYLGSEILFSDDDSYVYKGKMDYYTYCEIETGRMTPLEYDGNSVMESMAQNWSVFYNANNANYPLLNRLLNNAEWRQRYLAHFRTLIQDEMDTTTLFPLIDDYVSLIDTIVQNDPKKLYSYAQFNSGVAGVKSFIRNRRNYVLSNSEVNRPVPTLSNATWSVTGITFGRPSAGQPVNVQVEASAPAGIQTVNLYYASGIVGNFARTSLYDDGAHNDGAAGDGIWGGTIPGFDAGFWVRHYFEAVAADAFGTVCYLPAGAEHDVFVYQVKLDRATDTSVVINEVMAINQSTVTDSAGQFEDWIELYNNGTQAVDLSGYWLTDNAFNLRKWQMPAGTTILPNEYLIIWADEDGGQGDYHCNFKLSASGEDLLLINPAGQLVDEVVFGQQTADQGYARVPNGTGPFVIQYPTFGANNSPSTGVSSVETPVRLLVYPNPANGYITVAGKNRNGELVEVYDMVGRAVYSGRMQETLTIDTRSWTAGIYNLRYGSESRKLLIRH
jgi:spore coat protein CotH